MAMCRPPTLLFISILAGLPVRVIDVLEVALTARTYGELAALTTDLPVAPGSARGIPVPKPKDVLRIDYRSGNAKRDGH